MDSVKKGVLFVIVAAAIFGSTPILTRITYDEGANGVTMVFLRSAMALPFLFIIMKIRKIPLATSPAERRDLFFTGLAFAATIIMMYGSYAYIPVGEAMTLHFIYPALVSLVRVLYYKEKPTKAVLVALALSVAGVCMFSGNMSFVNLKSGGTIGFLLALASGVTYALYIILVDKPSLRQVPTLKVTLSVCVTAALCSAIFGGGGFGGGLSFGLSPKGWAYAWIVALTASVVAIALLQEGIKYTGATRAAILSTAEPITSVLCGALFLGESLSLTKMTGCVCIVASVIIVATAGKPKKIPT